MHTLLRIPVSRRGEDSHSLELLERFTESFQRQHAETVVVDRDHPESGFTTASAAIDEAAARCGSAAATEMTAR